MTMARIRLWFAAMALAVLGACTTTGAIDNAPLAGFEFVGVADGFRDYRCTQASCGGAGTEVSHLTERGGALAPLLDAALDSAANRKELADAFFDEFSGAQGMRLGATQSSRIGGVEAYQAAGTALGFPIHVVLLVTDSTAEIFLSVADTRRQARQATNALARAFAT